jgi:hypothetical protein
MRTKKRRFAGALTLAVLSSALIVGGSPAYSLSEGVVVCAQQGAQAVGDDAALMRQSNQGVFPSTDSPTTTAEANPPPTVDCDL